MKEALETIIYSLISNKDAVTIKEVINDKNVILEVKVAKEDMGKVIGREGKIARAIRTLMKALGAKENKKVIVEFVD